MPQLSLRPRPAALWLAPVAAGLLLLSVQAQRFVPAQDPDHPHIKYADSTMSLNDRCIVRKTRLSPDIAPVYVNRQPIGFCCAPCPATFLASPESYLRAMHFEFLCPVKPGRKVLLTPVLKSVVNTDLFYFSDFDAKETFDGDPLKYCGRLTDPVTGLRFEPRKKSWRVEHGGHPWFFSSDSTLRVFEANPDSFALRR